MGEGIYIGKVARAAGLTPQAIRFYERLGLIERARRTSSGYRICSPTTLERVQFINQAQSLGLSLKEIQEVLRLKYSAQSPCKCVRELLKQKLNRLKKQIVAMEKVREEIERCLRASRSSSRLPHSASVICPMIQMKGARKPRGPRRKGDEHA